MYHGPSGPSPWARIRACGTSLPASRLTTVASWRYASRNCPLLFSRTTYSSPTHARLTQPAFGRKRPAAGRPAAASVLRSAGSAVGSPTNGVDWSHTYRVLHHRYTLRSDEPPFSPSQSVPPRPHWHRNPTLCDATSSRCEDASRMALRRGISDP